MFSLVYQARQLALRTFYRFYMIYFNIRFKSRCNSMLTNPLFFLQILFKKNKWSINALIYTYHLGLDSEKYYTQDWARMWKNWRAHFLFCYRAKRCKFLKSVLDYYYFFTVLIYSSLTFMYLFLTVNVDYVYLYILLFLVNFQLVNILTHDKKKKKRQ